MKFALNQKENCLILDQTWSRAKDAEKICYFIYYKQFM